MDSSYQYRVFKAQYTFLQEGVRPAVEKLAKKLYVKHLIPSSTVTLITGLTADQKSTELLKVLGSRIKAEPKALYDFMAVLREMSPLRHLFRDLNERLPVNLQPEFLTDPPFEEEDNILALTSANQSIASGQQSYNCTVILPRPQPLPSSIVTGLLVYNDLSLSTSANEVTIDLPAHILDQQCEDIPLAKIAKEMSDYETIYMYFGLKKIDLEDLAKRYPQHPLRQRQELLLEWREKHGRESTYGKLINCFKEAGRPDLVNTTCKILQSHYMDTDPSVRKDMDTDPSVREDIDTDPSVHEGLGDTTLVASPSDLDEKEDPDRSSFQSPKRAPSEGPLPFGLFQKQQSQLQSPNSLDGSLSGDMPQIPHIITTMPSHSSTSSDDQLTSSLFNLHIMKPVVPEADQELCLSPTSPVSRHLRLECCLSSSINSEDSFHTACTHHSNESLNDLKDGEMIDEELRRDFQRIAQKYNNRLAQKEQEVQDLKRKLKEKDKLLKDARQECSEKDKQLKILEERLAKEPLKHPIQEVQPYASEIDSLKQKLEITNEFIKSTEQERDEIAGELPARDTQLQERE